MAHVVSYQDLIVWQRSMDLVVTIYALPEQFPAAEKFGLTAQKISASLSLLPMVQELLAEVMRMLNKMQSILTS